jgi:hypothetical protein
VGQPLTALNSRFFGWRLVKHRNAPFDKSEKSEKGMELPVITTDTPLFAHLLMSSQKNLLLRAFDGGDSNEEVELREI